MSKPFIVIFNGLSAEGVSVIECLLETSEHMWRIRCIVLQSEMSNPIIHSMVSRGVDVIAIPSSSFSSDYFQNAKIFENAYAVYALTMPNLSKSEYDQGIEIADASKKSGIKYFISTSLPNVKKESKGKYNVPYWVSKAEFEEYVKSLGFKYVTVLIPGFYYQTLQSQMAPITDEQGGMLFLMPDIPWIEAFDVRDTGEAVNNLLRNPDRFNNQQVPLFVQRKPPGEYVQIFNEVTGKKARCKLLPVAQWENQAKAGPILGEIFRWVEEFGYFGKKVDPLGATRILPNAKMWIDFLDETKWNGITPPVVLKSRELINSSLSPHVHHKKRLVVVMNCLGSLSYSVINSLLDEGHCWKVRGIVSKNFPLSETDKRHYEDLKSKGIEILTIDTTEKKEFSKAFDGAYAVYSSLISEYNGTMETLSERQQCELLVQGAKNAGVTHFIWSHRPHKKLLNSMTSPNFIEQAIGRRGISDFIMSKSFKYVSFLEPTIFFENFENVLCPSFDESGSLVFELPKVEHLCTCSVNDTGAIVRTLLNEPSQWNGMDIPICSDYMTPLEFVKTFKSVSGMNARVKYTNLEKMKQRGAVESVICEMIGSFSDMDERDLKMCRRLHPSIRTWQTWLSEEGHLEHILERAKSKPIVMKKKEKTKELVWQNEFPTTEKRNNYTYQEPSLATQQSNFNETS